MVEKSVVQATLIHRLETGRNLISKRKWFFRAGDWLDWARKDEHRKQASVLVLVSLTVVWMVLTLVIAVSLNEIDIMTSEQYMIPCMLVILALGGIFFLFSHIICDILIGKLQEIDKKNGWSAEIQSVLPDVPYYCWRGKAMNKLISYLNRGKAKNLSEAISLYVKAEYRKQQIKGVFKGILNWLDWEIDQSIRRAAATNLPPMTYITWL